MGHLIPPDVAPGLRYNARRYLTINGREFQPGDHIPLNLVPPEKLTRWIETRTIVPDNGAAKPPLAAPAEANGAATIQAEGAGDGSASSGAGGGGESKAAGNGTAHDGPIIGTPESHIQHIGRGWYNVTHAGKTEKVRTEAKAAERLAVLQGAGSVAQGEELLANDPERAGGASPVSSVSDETGPMADGQDGREAAQVAEAGSAETDAADFEQLADAAAVMG